MQMRGDEGERTKEKRAFQKNGDRDDACPRLPQHQCELAEHALQGVALGGGNDERACRQAALH